MNVYTLSHAWFMPNGVKCEVSPAHMNSMYVVAVSVWTSLGPGKPVKLL